MARMDVDGLAILVANVAGVIYAVDDTCTHEDASLFSGRLDGGLVKCPLHGSRFCLRTGAPMEDPADEPLRCHHVKVSGGSVQVTLSEPTRS